MEALKMTADLEMYVLIVEGLSLQRRPHAAFRVLAQMVCRVCMLLHVCVCTYTCTYMCVCMYVCMYACTCSSSRGSCCNAAVMLPSVSWLSWCVVYVCFCIYVCMYVCMHTCTYVYVCMYACIYVSTCMYVCLFVCKCSSSRGSCCNTALMLPSVSWLSCCVVYVFYMCMYVCIYVCLYMYMYVCMYTCTYSLLRASRCNFALMLPSMSPPAPHPVGAEEMRNSTWFSV